MCLSCNTGHTFPSLTNVAYLACHNYALQYFRVGSEYGLAGELSAADLDLQKRCSQGQGGTACHFLNVSVSLWSQLSSAGKDASTTTAAWISKEVRAPIRPSQGFLCHYDHLSGKDISD
jgi:hypothetical protein